jgi:hypothetical protein
MEICFYECNGILDALQAANFTQHCTVNTIPHNLILKSILLPYFTEKYMLKLCLTYAIVINNLGI